MPKIIRLALTTGDIDGIGFEVTAKALAQIKPIPHVQFLLFRSPQASPKFLKFIEKNYQTVTVSSLSEALKIAPNHKQIIDIRSHLSPATWVNNVAHSCMKKDLAALITAPLSKITIQQAGYKAIGHTDLLKKAAKIDTVFMAFIGSKFNVLLITDHISIKNVSRQLKPELLQQALFAADQLRSILKSKKPLALLGINPHAGEKGIIGNEEKQLFTQILDKSNLNIVGPLVPDAAFFSSNWKKYSVYICPYHDQGLIPFKMVHEQNSGVHITMGLPFIRTSVDHGTAKDIFNKNKANPNSMYEAIMLAVKLCKQSTKKKSSVLQWAENKMR